MTYRCSKCCSYSYNRARSQDWSQCLLSPSLTCEKCGFYPLHDALYNHASDEVVLALIQANKDAAHQSVYYGIFPLHIAMEKNRSDDVILALLESNKDAADKVVDRNRLPLHNAIELKFSDEVILALLEANKDAANRLDYYGKLPLNRAMELRCSDSVILALLEANKDAANKPERYGDLPLHTAIELRCSDNVFLALLEANKDAVDKQDHNGRLPLNRAMELRCSDTFILALLEVNKDAANKLDQYGRLLVNTAITFGCSDTVVLALLDAEKNAIHKLDNSHVLPLNKAMEFKRSDTVILALIEAHKDAANKLDHTRSIPLNNAMKLRCSDTVILALVGATTVAATKLERNGELPLRRAIDLKMSDKVILSILEANKEAAKEESHFSPRMLPLHRAIELKCSDTVILTFLDANKGAANKLDSSGSLPLYRAIESKCSDKVILAMLEANKYAASKQRPYGDLPLNRAIEVICSNKVILALLAANSIAASTKNRYQKLPLLVAIELNYNEEIISALVTAYPDAACDRDSNSMTLMYHAVQKGYSDTILAELLAAVFNRTQGKSRDEALSIIIQGNMEQVVLKAAAILSDHERYNMLCNIIENTKCTDAVVLSLLSAHPEAACNIALEFKRSKEEMTKGELPLHKAIRNKHSEEVVLALFDAYNNASQKESVDGELPLHQAIKSEYSDQVALKILSAYPCAAMIPCKLSGKLPLHFAAASSASARLVECLIAEYPEALHIAVNNLTPRNLVTAALPMESIKLICRPSLHNYGMHAPQHAEKDKDEESGNTESLKHVAIEVAKMTNLFEGFCSNLLELNVKVNDVQKRLEKHSTNPNDRVSLDISSFFVCENPAGDSDPLGMPIAAESSFSKAKTPPRKRKNRKKGKSRGIIKESNNDHNEFSEPQTLGAVVDLSDLSCNAVTTLKTNSTVAPQKSETFEPSGSLESREEPLQLEKQQNLLITESLLRSQTSAAKCSVAKVTDASVSKMSDDKVDFDNVQPASEVNSKLIFSAESSECGTIVSEPNLLDVSSEGSNTENFNSFVIVGKHIRVNSLGSPELVDKGSVEQNPKTDYLDEVEGYGVLEEIASHSSLSGSDGGFFVVDDMSNSDNEDSVKDQEEIISIRSSFD